MFNFIKHQKIFLGLSGVLVVLAILALLVWGIPTGIDFTGGSLLHVRFEGNRPGAAETEEALRPLEIPEVRVQPAGEQDAFLRMSPLTNDERDAVLASLREQYGEVQEESFSSIGPTIGRELQRKAVIAIIAVIVGIILYITWAFRKVSAGPVPAWFYGVGAILALMHDILIPLGLYAVLGKYVGVEADTLFVTALLTILGFSVHDTIVVYDRIRENLRMRSGETFARVVNFSLNETLIRSINTSITTLLVLLALFMFGGESIRYFVLTLSIGIAIGTYSSMFVAGPLLVYYAKYRGE